MTQALTVAEVLERAADLLTPEGAWTQAAWARDDNNVVCSFSSVKARCFCAEGAIARFSLEAGTKDTHGQALRALGYKDGIHLNAWNDAPERTQAEVTAALREAAERERTS